MKSSPRPSSPTAPPSVPAEAQPKLELSELQSAWKQAILPAVAERSIPTSSVLAEAHPVELAGDKLVIEFPPAASFHRNLAEEPKNADLLAEILFEVTGRRLTPTFAVGEGEMEEVDSEEGPISEEDIISLMKSTFDAREVTDE